MEFEKTLPLLPRIGRFQLTRELGRGSMGVVYEAFDPKLERTVALKTVCLQGNSPENREFEERFQREARSAGRLNHPSIVTIHDAGEDNGTAYIAMEFLEGKTLRDILDSGVRLPLDDIISYALQLADGIDYAHRFGIVHRDIKPSNIVVSSQGRVKISDFGIAQLPSGDLTQAGTILGTPKYMSPEQVRGERLDGRSDIFSLGVILYEMLVGAPPFSGDSLTAIMYQILHGKPADPVVENADCSAGLRQIVARCLAKDKDERYAEAGEVAADLRQHLHVIPDPALMAASFAGLAPSSNADGTQPLEALVESAVVPAAGSRRRLWQWLGVAGALSVLLLGLGIWNASTPAPAPIPQAVSGVKAASSPTSTAVPPSKPSSESAPGDTPTQPAAKKKSSSKPKSFWQRQMDCIKHGICEKPTHTNQPASP